jgi:hypothetical protein
MLNQEMEPGIEEYSRIYSMTEEPEAGLKKRKTSRATKE